MAGDWIKMRADLLTHPKVVRIASALKADNLRTVGGLMSVWCLFDAHSEDGNLDGYTIETLDDHLRWPGFAAQMIAVGWLESDGQMLVLPRFDSHNGQSAKRRAQEADRKREARKASAPKTDKVRTREEKRREDIHTTLPTRAGVLCMQLRALGVEAAPHQVQLIELLNKYTDEQILAVAEIAAKRKNGGRVTVGYLVPMLADAGKPSTHTKHGSIHDERAKTIAGLTGTAATDPGGRTIEGASTVVD